MARTVEDLQTACETLSGRHILDPSSCDVALYGEETPRRAAVVRNIPGVDLPGSALSAIDRVEEIMISAGWETEEVQPPELEAVHEIWGYVLGTNFKPMVDDPEMFPSLMSKELVSMWAYIFDRFDPERKSVFDLFTERARLSALWDKFFVDYPVMIGPVWTDIQFINGSDLTGEAGYATTIDLLRFISPANLLGLPSVALTTGEVDGLPVGVQVYAARWRDDLSLKAAAEVEREVGIFCPIDPRF